MDSLLFGIRIPKDYALKSTVRLFIDLNLHLLWIVCVWPDSGDRELLLRAGEFLCLRRCFPSQFSIWAGWVGLLARLRWQRATPELKLRAGGLLCLRYFPSL